MLSRVKINEGHTLSSGDVIADISLTGAVQCVQELVKLIHGLAAEHRQQLLVLTKQRQLSTDVVALFCAENTSLIKFTDKSGMFRVQMVH